MVLNATDAQDTKSDKERDAMSNLYEHRMDFDATNSTDVTLYFDDNDWSIIRNFYAAPFCAIKKLMVTARMTGSMPTPSIPIYQR